MEGDQAKNMDAQFISFHDFPATDHAGNNEGQLNTGASTHHQPFNNLPNDSTGIGIIEDLQGISNKTEEGTAQRSFWTIEYYQKYFNVNTNDILERLKQSMLPYSRDNYLITHIRPNPDLYGPFWICMTLVFSIAISGNMANYFQTDSTAKHHWKYEFHVVSYVATCIFLYAWLLPLALWGTLQWTNGSRNTEEELIESYAAPGLLELLCLYGYSLTIYIPAVFLWTIQIGWLQWCLAILATLLSGSVLLRSLLPVIAGKHRIIYAAVIMSMHLLLAAGFMLYFFHASSKNTVTAMADLVASPTQASILHKVIQNNNSHVQNASQTSVS